MSREEEIIDEANKYCKGNKGCDAMVRAAFLMGALWADSTMIENASKWLEENTHNRIDGRDYMTVSNEYILQDDFIELFKKAMENL